MQKRGKLEEELFKAGHRLVGVDEVGRGCIAGPVYTACVALNYEKLFKMKKKDRELIRDSKTLSAKQRQSVLPLIQELSIECFIGISSVGEIERHGIAPAIFLAMRRALGQCATEYDLLLVDGNQKVSGYRGEQMTIIGGDFLCYGIAAASIVAKEARDLFMREQAVGYPHYGFERHVGYSTQEHLDALKEHSYCPLHRKNFSPISSMVEIPKVAQPLFAELEVST